MRPVAVLGTGMAGFGAGYALEKAGVPFVLYDRNPYYGGHTWSFRYDSGFAFDDGANISVTKHRRVRDRPAHVQAEPGRARVRRAGRSASERALRRYFPLSVVRRIHDVSRGFCEALRTSPGSSTLGPRSRSTGPAIRERCFSFVRQSDFLDAAP